MRTVLVNLPWFKDGRFGVRAGSRWPFTSKPERDGHIHYIPFPFFLAYTAALLKKEGKGVKLVDAIAGEMSEAACIEEIAGFDPGLVLVETSTPSFKNDMRIIAAIRQSLKGIKIGLCGAHAGEFAAEILKEHESIDYVIVGEYEQVALDLVNALEGGRDLRPVAGLAYREGGGVVLSDRRGSVDDLDVLPWPERLVPLIYKYNDGFAGLPCPSVQMLASRGCPFQCSFCLLPQTLYKGNGYRKRDFMDVVDEMEHLVRQFDFKAVYFDDEVFNCDRGYVVKICEEIIRRGLHVPWAAMTRVDLMDEELLETMARAGAYAVKYGIESADQDIRSQCKKSLDLDKARAVIGVTKRLGIKVHLTFCIGLPGETRQTMQSTIDFAREMDPDSLQFTFATPYPGTEYFRYAQGKGWLGSVDWDDYDGNEKFIVRTMDLSIDDLESIKPTLYQIFKGKCGCQ